MTHMKLQIAAALFLAFFASSSFAGAKRNLTCISYSKAYRISIAVESMNPNASLTVQASSAEGAYALRRQPEINLAVVPDQYPGWVEYKGLSVEKKEVRIRFLNADLRLPQVRVMMTTTKSIYDGTTWGHELQCR